MKTRDLYSALLCSKSNLIGGGAPATAADSNIFSKKRKVRLIKVLHFFLPYESLTPKPRPSIRLPNDVEGGDPPQPSCGLQGRRGGDS